MTAGAQRERQHRKAKVISRARSETLLAARQVARMANVSSGVMAPSKQDIENLSKLEELVGPIGRCACEPCRAIDGSIAYYADLLRFVDTIGPLGADAQVTKDSAAMAALKKRRPDLPELLLTCANESVLVPEVDLIIELLGHQIEAHATDAKATPIPTETQGTTAERAAQAQVEFPAAAAELATAYSPIGLPYDPGFVEARAFAELAGADRADLVQIRAQGDGVADGALVARAWASWVLGLADARLGAVCAESTAAKLWSDAAGKASEVPTAWSVAQLTAKLSVGSTRLRELAGCRFVSDPPTLEFKDKGGKCRPEDTLLVATSAGGATTPPPGAQIVSLGVLARLVADLAKSPYELDRLLWSLGAVTVLSTDKAVVLATGVALSRKVNATIDEVLAWQSPRFDTHDYPGSGPQAKSPYRRVFLDSCSFPGFTLQAIGTDLSDQLDDSPSSNAALAAALRIAPSELSEIRAHLSAKSLDLRGLKAVWRVASIARAFGVSCKDLRALERLVTPSGAAGFLGTVTDAPSLAMVSEAWEALRLIRRHGSTPTALESDLLVAAAEPGAAQVFASLVSAGAAKGIEGPPTEPRSWVSDSEIGAALGVPEALAARLADASASLLIPIPLEYKKFHGRKTIEVVGDACSVGSRPALAPPSESATVREWLNWCLEWTQWMFEPDADLNISILEDKWLQTYSRIVMRRMAGWLARASRWTASLDFGSTEVGWALALEPETSATLGLVAVHPDFAALKAAAVSPSTLVSLMTPPAQGSYKPSAQGLQERFRGVSRLWAYLDAREAIGAGSEGLLAGLVTAADSKEDKPALDTQPHPKQLEYLSADFGWDHDDITCFAKDYALGTVRSAGVTPVELSQLATVGWATRVARSGELLLWLARALGAARGVRTSAQQLRALAIYEGEDLSSKAAAAARVVAQGRVESADWLSRAADVHRRLSGNLRDAMLAYVLERPSSVSLSGSVTPADLVAHLLTDPQVGTCRDTTRLLFCTAAAQTFVDRVERGLEGASLASLDTSERDQWRWMRRFRVWQANRRVFLYPENYLLPELRRTKSQGYEKFEQGIGAGRPDRTRVEALVSEYLNELHAMTGASIVSFTVSAPKSQFGAAVRPTLHIVGKPLDPAGRFVYREFVQCSRWTPWGDVDVDFGAFAPIPVLVGGSVLLVAPKLEAQPLQPSPEKDVTSDGYPKEQVTLKLVIARQQDGGWGKAAEVTCASPLQSDVSPADAGPPDLASAVQAALWYSARAVGNDSLEVVFYTTYHRAYTTPGYFRKAFVISPDLSVSAEPATVWEYDAEHTIDEWKIRPSLGLGTAVLAGDVCGALKANITPELGVTISDGSSNTVLSGTLMLVGDQATALALDQDTPIPVTGIAPWCRLPLVIQAMGTQFLVLPQTGWEDGDPWAPDGSAPLQPHTSSLIDSADKLMEQVAALEHDSSAPASAPSSPVSPATVQLGSGDPNAVAPGLKKGEDPLDLAVGWSSVVGNRPTLKWMSRPEASKSTGVLATAHVVGSPWASRYRFMWSAGGRAALYVPALQKCPDFPLFSADPGEQLPAYRLLRPAYGFDSTGGITHDVFPSVNQVGPQVDASSTLDIVPFRPDAPCAEYDWELFCHIPVATARRLADEGAFDQAVEWLQCVLDLRRRRAGDPGACWVAKVLREDAEACLAIAQGVASKGGIADALASARAQIDAYLTAPFTPHAIAAYRVSAHRWFVALQYVAVLLDWGDALFRQFTRESLAEALGLYEQAADVLGARPDVVVTSATENGAKSYGSLREDLDSLGDALLPEGMFEGLPVTSSGGSTGAADVATAWMASNYFCVPLNPALAAYWDRVGDRLFKLRHCLDIDGAERRLPLYAAPIDPLLLVKAAAAGVDIGAAIGATPALPATRFAATLGLASSLTSAGASLGAQLLTYLEKRDTEGLAQLRASRDENIEALRRGARQEQVRVAKQTRVELEAAHRAVLHRQAYYEQLKAEGRSAEEDRQHALTVKVSDAQREAKASILQAVLDAICPSVNVGFSNLTPFFTTSLGGNILAQISTIRSAAILGTAAFQGTDASIAGLEAGWQRREQEWGQQLEQATDELARIDAQLITADLQIAVAQAEDRVQEAAANLAAEVTDYLESRFTNAELYQWLSSRVSSLYYATYDLALHAARRAERCYAYETGDESAQFVQTNDWVAGRKGLLAAETLGLALRRMEAAFQEKNTRDLELTKTISLAKDFPAAFFDLITTGVAQVSLSEACFDEDHPGHYFRRVRSVSVSVPAVAGPYESVNLTLSLEAGSSRIRAKARLAGEVGDTYDDAGLSSRDIQALPRTLVTSTGREDTGVGPDAAGDGRYLPFEGAGVIGTWNLTMLQEANDFDLSTVTDVVLTIRYSARSSGLDADAQRKLAKLARTYVRKERAAALGLTGESCGLVLSLASDFGAAWTAFRSQATPASLLLPLGEMRLTERLPLDQPKVVGVGLAVAIFSRDSLETAGTWRVSYTTPGQEDKHLDFEAKPNDIQPPPDQAGQVGDKNGLPGPDRPWALYSSPMKSSDWAVPEMVRLDAPVELKTAVIEDVLLLLQFASGTSTVIKPADEED